MSFTFGCGGVKPHMVNPSINHAAERWFRIQRLRMFWSCGCAQRLYKGFGEVQGPRLLAGFKTGVLGLEFFAGTQSKPMLKRVVYSFSRRQLCGDLCLLRLRA